MKFYTKEKDKILIRSYEPIEEKICEYKRKNLAKYHLNKLIAEIIWDPKEYEFYIIEDNSISTKEQQIELIERYCKGEITNYALRELCCDRVLDPIDYAKKNIEQYPKDGIVLREPLVLLERFINGDIYFTDKELLTINQLLECFNFSDEILDEVDIDLLKILYDKKYIHFFDEEAPKGFTINKIINYTIENAEQGTKVYQKAIQTRR